MKIFQLIDLIIRLFRLNKKSKVVLLFLIPTFLVGQNNAAFWLGKRPSGAAPANLLLDDYPGAGVAYSLRKLDKDYGGFAVEVRRSSDGNTQNIGFSNNDFDTASLNSFCSGTSCRVRTWYDQSGNGRDAVQTTVANQPLIYASGSVILINGKPAINWPDYSQAYWLRNNSFNFAQPNTVFTALYYNGASSRQDYVFDTGGSATRSILLHLEGDNKWSIFSGNLLSEAAADLTPRQLLFTQLHNSTTSVVRKNGTQTIFGNAGTQSFAGITIGNFGQNPSPLFNHSGSIHEIIIYPANKTTDFAAIETNINTYYSIY